MFELMIMIGISLLSTILFASINGLIGQMDNIKPNLLLNNEYQTWRWRNIMVSFIHSIVISFGVIIAIILEPSLLTDMLDSYSDFAYSLISFTNGYFVYDLLLSLKNITFPGRFEIIFHHIVTISSLLFVLWKKFFIGYIIVALSVEISNVFLHSRQLFSLYNVTIEDTLYFINSILTIITFIFFRFLTLIWIIFCLYNDQYKNGKLIYCYLAMIACLTIIIISVFIIIRVALNDFIQPKIRHEITNKANK